MRLYDLGVVFTGHMMDAPGRKEPRFPATMYRDAEKGIRQAIKNSWYASDNMLFIGSGARGADIIAMEIAVDLDVRTHLVLPFNIEDFVKSSVGDPDIFCWRERLYALMEKVNTVTVLPGTGANEDFIAANDKMVEIATAQCSRRRLIAFWDQKGGDGIGGTGHFVKSFKEGGGMAEIIDAAMMLHLHKSDLAAPVSYYDQD